MKTTLKIFALLATLSLMACNESGGGSTAPTAKPVSGVPSTPDLVTPADPGTPQTVSVTYYSVSRTEAPVSGWVAKTYTATGSCLTHLAKTYCFDDGLQTIDFTSGGNHYGPYRYSFWGTDASGGPCYGGCTTDGFASPKEMVGTALTQVGGQANVDAIFSSGISHAITCQEDTVKLDCGSFAITF